MSKKLGLSTVALGALLACLPAHAAELKFWMVTPSSDAAVNALNKAAEDFSAANPDTPVKIESRGIDEHKSAMRIAASSDQGPDIFYMWAGLGLGGEFIKAGMSEPLDKYYTEYKWSDRFVPAAGAFADLYPGGKQGVPYTFRGEVVYYDKELFSKAGITAPPATYDELVADAQKLKDAGIAPFAFGGTVNWHVMRLMDVILETKCGAEKHDALMAMTVKWTDEACATESFNEFHKWTSEYFLKPFMGIGQEQAFNLFVAGRAAMMLEGDWLVNQLAEASPDKEYDIFPFPTGTNRLYGFGEYLYVNSKSPQKDAAAKFLDYLTSDAVQQANAGAFGSSSINKNVALKEPKPLEVAWQKVFNTYGATFVNGDQAFPLDVTTEYFRVINEVASDNLAPEAAPAELQKFIDNRQ